MYKADEKRYEKMTYLNCGKSGFKLPRIALGLWQNFGYMNNFANMEEMCQKAFDMGINYFDLANNYGFPYNGSAEENFGKILKRGLSQYRDELCIATKAGYDMWEGPYGARHGSRKYLISSLDQSLKRMNLEYVDIFYHHIYDPTTPAEEVAVALDQIVRSGKALYVGVSNYNTEQTKEINKIFKELKTPFIVNQPSYSMLNRWIEEDGLYEYAKKEGIGLAVFSPLYQGLLTDRYLKGIPDSPNAKKGRAWIMNEVNDEMVTKLNKLNDIAQKRGQKLSQMALAYVLRNDMVNTVIIGASSVSQIEENFEAIKNISFSNDEITQINEILKK